MSERTKDSLGFCPKISLESRTGLQPELGWRNLFRCWVSGVCQKAGRCDMGPMKDACFCK